jgi:hypothetical protein
MIFNLVLVYKNQYNFFLFRAKTSKNLMFFFASFAPLREILDFMDKHQLTSSKPALGRFFKFLKIINARFRYTISILKKSCEKKPSGQLDAVRIPT